jgi:hypothetical protein
VGLLDGSYIDRPACAAAVDRMHERDAVGDRVHLWLACLGMFLVSGPTTVTELAFVPLAVFFVVRTLNIRGLWIHAVGQPVVLAVGLLAAWAALSLLWSRDVGQGLDEIVRLRWVLLVVLVFPAFERRGVLVRALAWGLIVAGLAQLASGWSGLRPPFEQRHPGRVSGWWDPVVAGTIQAAAVGLFLPAALRGVGRDRWLGLLGLGVALAGLVASGTRGAWVSTAVFLVVAVPWALRGADRRAWWGAMAVGVAGVLVLAGGAVVMRDGMAVRVGQARAELAAAVAGDLDSPTGARIAVMGAAWEAGVARPLGGAGAGSVNAVATDRLGPDHAAAGLEHAHSMWLHWFGTLGVPGVVLGGLVFVTAVRGAGRAAGGLSGGSWLPRGVGFALVSLAVAGLFDAVLINMQSCALFGALAAVGCCGCGAEQPSGVTGRG